MKDIFDAEAIIDAMAPYLGLPLEAEYRWGIAVHLTVAHQIAQNVLAFETGDDTEPAPVYRP